MFKKGGTAIAKAFALAPESREEDISRQIRDLVVTLAALFALFTMLISISPGLRERTGVFSGGISDQQWDASRGVLGHTIDSTLSVVSGFATTNTYLFAFLVVACVLFVLMVRT